MEKPLTRRTALKVTGSLGIGIATGSILVTNAAAGDHTFAEELDIVRDTTRKYRDVDVAKEEDGYRFFGVVPHAGVVYEKLQENIGKLGLTDQPTLLFYAPSEELEEGDSEEDVEETTLTLAGIEKHVVGAREEGDPPPANIFDDENAARKLKVTEAEGWHPSPTGADITGLHAWVHMANPDGVFARDHPVMLERIEKAD